MTVDDDIRHLIHENDGEQSLRNAALKSGMRSIRENGITRVLNGETCLEEVLRVSQS